MVDHVRRNALATIGGAAITGFLPWRAKSASPRQPLGYLRTNWSEDPWARGAYSFFAKGSGRRDSRHLAAPVDDRIFFAGEAAFLQRNSTVHAAFESGCSAAADVASTTHRRIAVIGAGVSGLAAAQRLDERGLDVTVFEARDRIGGRIWTDPSLGLPLDMGASWIHGVDENPIAALSDALGLERVATGYDYELRGEGGRMISDRDAPDWLEDVLSVQHRVGADPEDINNLAYWRTTDYTGAEEVHPAGYEQILEGLSGGYGLVLETPVTNVRLADRRVELGFQDRSTEAFDAVVVTLPLGVLKADTVTFDPPLPQRKQRAIERLGMALLDKLYLLYEEPFWEGAATWIGTPENGLPPGQFNQWLNLHRYIGEPVILAFNGGTPARQLANLSDEDLVRRAVQTLDTAFPV